MSFKKGHIGYWTGKKRPDMSKKLKGHFVSNATRKQIGKLMKGKHPIMEFKKGHPAPKTAFKKGITPWNKGKKLLQFSGKNHPRWIGNTPLKKQIRDSFEYRQWRSDIFTRDNFTCVLCGKNKIYLEADHYPKPFIQIFNKYNIKTLEDALNCQEFWNINNGRTLCINCHNKTKKGVKT